MSIFGHRNDGINSLARAAVALTLMFSSCASFCLCFSCYWFLSIAGDSPLFVLATAIAFKYFVLVDLLTGFLLLVNR